MSHVYTLLAVMVGWVFFRAASLGQALGMLRAMCGVRDQAVISETAPMYLNNEVLFALVAGVLASTPFFTQGARALSERLRGRTLATGFFETAQVGALASIFLFAVMQLAAGTYNPFIYFRF